MKDVTSILIASPIQKEPDILECFFESLMLLERQQVEIQYCFIDDNENNESREMIQAFLKGKEGIVLHIQDAYQNKIWEKQDHYWTSHKIDKVAYFKNEIIHYFLKGKWTHLFFVDSDLVLHPQTIQTLLKANKSIVSNIFWTKWKDGDRPLPQVWMKDFYTLYDHHMLRKMTSKQIQEEEDTFLERLKKPGIYQIGGLGACTLLEREVLERGVHFGEIYNLSFWGEDRSFCIRAAAYGFKLYVDTHYPAYHIFRKEELNGARKKLDSYRGTEEQDEEVKRLQVLTREIVEKRETIWQQHVYEGYRGCMEEKLGHLWEEKVEISRIETKKEKSKTMITLAIQQVQDTGHKIQYTIELTWIVIKEKWQIINYKVEKIQRESQ